ncbi:MAG: V-type ATP synthase subunit E [Candidatus Ranarchaeia archaeon]
MADQIRGLPDIVGEILLEAEKEATKRILEAEAQAEKILEDAELEAERKYNSIIADTKTKISSKKQVMTTQFKLEVKHSVLELKQKLLDQLFKQVSQKLYGFTSDKQYITFLKRIISDSIETLKAQSVLIALNQRDQRLIPMADLKKIEKETGVKIQVAKQVLDAAGGVIIESGDLKRSLDYTFENILSAMRTHYRDACVRELFGDE